MLYHRSLQNTAKYMEAVALVATSCNTLLSPNALEMFVPWVFYTEVTKMATIDQSMGLPKSFHKQLIGEMVVPITVLCALDKLSDTRWRHQRRCSSLRIRYFVNFWEVQGLLMIFQCLVFSLSFLHLFT